MYKYWIRITVVTLVKLRLNAANHFKMCVFRLDYADRLVASFANQIQSEYYGGNRSVSIEVIALEHFCALPQTKINSSTKPCPRHAVFCYFLLDNSKQNAATTTAHSKILIEQLYNKKSYVN